MAVIKATQTGRAKILQRRKMRWALHFAVFIYLFFASEKKQWWPESCSLGLATVLVGEGEENWSSRLPGLKRPRARRKRNHGLVRTFCTQFPLEALMRLYRLSCSLSEQGALKPIRKRLLRGYPANQLLRQIQGTECRTITAAQETSRRLPGEQREGHAPVAKARPVINQHSTRTRRRTTGNHRAANGHSATAEGADPEEVVPKSFTDNMEEVPLPTGFITLVCSPVRQYTPGTSWFSFINQTINSHFLINKINGVISTCFPFSKRMFLFCG